MARAIDAKIADLMTLSNPTVGLAAHAGQTDIRITAKASSHEDAEKMTSSLAKEVKQRLGAWIYASGDDSIEQVVLSLLEDQNATLAVMETLSGVLIPRLQSIPFAASVLTFAEAFTNSVSLQQQYGSSTLGELASSIAQDIRTSHDTDYALVTVMQSSEDAKSPLDPGTAIAVASRNSQRSRTFGWTNRDRTDSDEWAATHALALLRRLILNSSEPD